LTKVNENNLLHYRPDDWSQGLQLNAYVPDKVQI